MYMTEDDLPSGPRVYHAIIHRPFLDIQALLDIWKTKCSTLAVAEHEADDEVPRTHCHILIGDPQLQRDRYNEILKQTIPGLEGRKDFLILVKTVKKKGKPSVPYDLEELLKYMAKGDRTRLKLLENISPAIVEKAVNGWVETDKSDNVSAESYMERVIFDLVELIGQEFPKHHKYHCEETEIDYEICKYNLRLLFENCRSKSYWILYKQKSIVPPPSLHKRVAASVFMRLAEKVGCGEYAAPYVIDRWY